MFLKTKVIIEKCYCTKKNCHAYMRIIYTGVMFGFLMINKGSHWLQVSATKLLGD